MRILSSVFLALLFVSGLTLHFSHSTEARLSEARVGTHGDINPIRGTDGPRS